MTDKPTETAITFACATVVMGAVIFAGVRGASWVYNVMKAGREIG